MFPLRYFFPVDLDYIDDDPSLPEKPDKPPLITRYRLFFSILLALE